jgi:SagB-type dehydrogenase family enzyme
MMKNKPFSISLLLNILLAIALIIIFYFNAHQKVANGLATDNSFSKNKLEANSVFKRLSFLSNQTDGLIKMDTSIILFKLPAPNIESNISIEEVMLKRRSRRAYMENSLLPKELSQVLWAAYGVTHPLAESGDGLKTCPSADGQYPLNIYVLVGNVKGLPKGVYKYCPGGHMLLGLIDHDKKVEVCSAADNQIMIKEAPVVLVYTGIPEKLLANEQEINLRWTNMEVGHSAQNVYLQATALNLGTCAIGWFNESKVRQILNIPQKEQILYMMPIGYPLYNR